jgi:hypothetical protein
MNFYLNISRDQKSREIHVEMTYWPIKGESDTK